MKKYKLYYIEVCDPDQDEPYCMQSRTFASAKSAHNWFFKNIDFLEHRFRVYVMVIISKDKDFEDCEIEIAETLI